MNTISDNISLNDQLSIIRTRLANERTFLAYFRSTIIFLASGISVYRLAMFSEIHYLGLVLIGLAPLTLLFGLTRYLQVKKKIKSYMK